MTKKLMMMAAAFAAALGAWADTETVGGYTWTYQISGDAAEISGVSPATGAVAIPATLGGKPVTSIGDYAFYDCSGLTGVTIPDSVTSIGDEAFSGCSGLTSVTIGSGVTSIGFAAFSGCSGLESVNISDLAAWCRLWFGEDTINPLIYAHKLYINGEVLTNLVVPDGITRINDGAFEGCSGLASVTIPDSVKSIGWYAFSGCSGLTSVTIPNSVTSIGEGAFSGCSGLASVTIGSGVTYIRYDAFSGCSGLTSVTIPDSVTGIGDNAFSDCYGLASVTFLGNAPSIGSECFRDVDASCYVSRNSSGWGVSIPGTWNGLRIKYIDDEEPQAPTTYRVTYAPGAKGIGSVQRATETEGAALTLAGAVFTRDGYTQTGWATSDGGAKAYELGASYTANVSVTLYPVWTENVETVGGYTWPYRINGGTAEIYIGSIYGSSSLAISPSPTGALTIPSSLGGYPVTSIGDKAFSGCSGLTSVTIPDGVTSIGYKAFYGCSGLASVTIPNSVTSIGGGAFRGCNESLFDTTTIPGVELVDGWAVGNTGSLSGDLDLTGVRGIIGGDAYSIGGDAYSYSSGGGAFSGCSGLTSVTIPDSVTSIGSSAFSGCEALTNVTIGVGVTSIRPFAFFWCSGLTSVTIPDSVKSIGWYAFSGCSGLTSVTIPDSVTSIGGGAFEDCSGLTSVTIPDSVTSIGYGAFSGCRGLTSVNITDLAKWCGIIFLTYDDEDEPGNPLLYAHNLYLNGVKVTDLVIPDSVTSIGDYAFRGCSGLTSVTIPDSVTSIGSSAFSGCSGLTSIRFGGNAPTVGYFPFSSVDSGCTAYVRKGSTGWGVNIPGIWNGLRIEYIEDENPQTYTITYKPGASGSGSQQTATKTHGVAMALKGAVFTRDGYVQTGWATSDGGAKVYDLGASYSANADLTLYPFWTADEEPPAPVQPPTPTPATYTVTYAPGANGVGSEQTATKTEDVALALKGAVFTRDGYTQTGWATSDGGAKVYDLGASYTANAAITLYPFWTADNYERVEGTFLYGYAQEVLKIVNEERSNAGVEQLVMTEELTDVAMMRAAETSVLFDHQRPNGLSCFSAFPDFCWSAGENIAMGQRSPGGVMGAWMNSDGHRNNILNKGYSKIGIGCFYDGYYYYWVQAFCAAPEASGSADKRTSEVKVTVDVSLDGSVDTIVSGLPYTITYKPGSNGTGAEQMATKTEDVALELAGAVFTREGYTQTGWATSDGGTKAYDLGASYTANADLLLYPFWTKNVSPEPPEPAPPVPDTYVVTYRPGTYGTGALQAATKTEGIVLALKGAIFTREDYTQTGWATSDGGAKAYDLGASYTVNAALTLYPFWSANTYKLTLTPNNANYGTVTGGGDYLADMTATLKAAAKTGYAFAGWFTDKACTKPLNPKGYDNRSPTVKVVVPENDTTIYAKFVTKAEAKKSLKFSSATAKLATTAAKATAGSAFSLKLGISSASLVTVTATGLPNGLKIDKATGAITGTATVPGDFTATVTVKDAAGNSISQKVKMTVEVAAYAKGNFYGTAKPGKKGDPTAYLQFTVAKTGKVSGKVTYKGKAYSFTSAYMSCMAAKATFAPKVKIGKTTFKPGTVTVKTQKLADLSLVEAANSKGTFAAQKKPNLVKKGKALAALVGKTFKFTKKTKNSGLTKSKDKLEVKLANGDAAKVSGVVGGKKLTALSWVTLVSGKATKGGSEVYTLYVDIIDAALKYERTLVITATVGSGSVKATAAFAK